MIAGIWMADGFALLVAPRHVMRYVEDMLVLSSNIRHWEGMGAVLGICLIAGTSGLRYEWLWGLIGLIMVIKGTVLLMAPARWRERILGWCLGREDVDYRFWGIGLCTLALLLLQAAGWIGTE
jgi:uncharacterized protein YjeT (DUF2065 family)